MPLDGLVGVGVAEVGVVGVCPTIDTQTYALAQRPAQVFPTDGFQARNCDEDMLWADAIASQLVSAGTK
jgi:hypothetical protein